MHARSTTLRGNPQKIDEGIAQVRDEVMPLVQGIDGFVGLSMLCDRESGRCIVTTAWESEDAMRASADRVLDARARAAEVMEASDPEVNGWEIAVMHRMHETREGACARVIWSRADDADRIDSILDSWRSTILPQLEQTDGFCSVSLLVDRENRRAVSAVVYDGQEAMDRSRDQAQAMRDRFAGDMGIEITEVAEFDVALAHLRVPEVV